MKANINGTRIMTLRSEHARQVAELHISGIHTGFISSLGVDFVTALYEAIAVSRFCFGLVIEKGDRVAGFIAFTTDINKLYWSVILKRGLHFIFMLASKLFSVRRIVRMLETIFYPSRISKMNAPRAELLSVVIAPEEQGRGLSRVLTCEELAECKRRGIDEVKVLVGAYNERANNLYLRCGFELVGQVENHGVLSNVYVVKTDRFGHYRAGVVNEFDGMPVEWQETADVADKSETGRELIRAVA